MLFSFALTQALAQLAQLLRERDELIRQQAKTEQAIATQRRLTAQIARILDQVFTSPEVSAVVAAALTAGHDALQDSLLRAELSPCEASKAAEELRRVYDELQTAVVAEIESWAQATRWDMLPLPVPFRGPLAYRVPVGEVREQFGKVFAGLQFAESHAHVVIVTLYRQHDLRTYLGVDSGQLPTLPSSKTSTALARAQAAPVATPDEVVRSGRVALVLVAERFRRVIAEGRRTLGRGTYRLADSNVTGAGAPVMPAVVCTALAALVLALSETIKDCARLSELTLQVAPAA